MTRLTFHLRLETKPGALRRREFDSGAPLLCLEPFGG